MKRGFSILPANHIDNNNDNYPNVYNADAIISIVDNYDNQVGSTITLTSGNTISVQERAKDIFDRLSKMNVEDVIFLTESPIEGLDLDVLSGMIH